jgi:hypothetical protein
VSRTGFVVPGLLFQGTTPSKRTGKPATEFHRECRLAVMYSNESRTTISTCQQTVQDCTTYDESACLPVTAALPAETATQPTNSPGTIKVGGSDLLAVLCCIQQTMPEHLLLTCFGAAVFASKLKIDNAVMNHSMWCLQS